MFCQVIGCKNKASQIINTTLFFPRGRNVVAVYLCAKHGYKEDKETEQKN